MKNLKTIATAFLMLLGAMAFAQNNVTNLMEQLNETYREYTAIEDGYGYVSGERIPLSKFKISIEKKELLRGSIILPLKKISLKYEGQKIDYKKSYFVSFNCSDGKCITDGTFFKTAYYAAQYGDYTYKEGDEMVESHSVEFISEKGAKQFMKVANELIEEL